MSPFASPSRRPSPYVEGLTRRRGGRGELPFAEPEPRSEVPRFNLCARDSTLNLFNGKIDVHPDAQKTDAKQSNRVLLLSDDAVIDTKPQLEIYADDVKCTHGATVGQIDETALYYLRSRGISEDLARSLLVYAFANEIASELELKAVREHVERFLLAGQSLTEL